MSPQVTPQVRALLSAIGSEEKSVRELMESLGLKDRHNFVDSYLNPAIESGFIVLVYPNRPRHPRQKYRRNK